MSKQRRDFAWARARHQAVYEHETGELVLCEVSETDCPDPNCMALLVESWEVDGAGNRKQAAPAKVVTVVIAAISQNLLDVDALVQQELEEAADRMKAHKDGMAKLTGLPRKPRPRVALTRHAEGRDG